jgi:hypothetical protein
MSNSRVKTFYIPMSYEVSVITRVDASSLEEACELVMEGEGTEISGQSYVSGSCVIHDRLIASSQLDINIGKFVRVSVNVDIDDDVKTYSPPDFIGYVTDIDDDENTYCIHDENLTKYKIKLDDVFPLSEDEISSFISDKLKQIVSYLK